MAIIEIDTIDKLIDFSNGVYGRGTSDSLLDVVLTADLDFEDASLVNWSGCKGSWYVNLDGQDHTISNIYFNGSGNWGFFETFYDGSISNLNLINVKVTATGSTGVIATTIGSITIENVHMNGRIATSGYCACFCPNGMSGTRVARNCSFTGSLTSTGSFCSLLTTEGDSIGFSTYNFTAICDIFSSSNLYLVTSYNAPITDNLFFRGTLKGNSNVYIGAWRGGGVTNSLFVLEDDSRSGSTYGALTNCYYDNSGASISGLTGVTTEEMKSRSWLNSNNFDSDIWQLDDKNEGYPYSVDFIEYTEPPIWNIGEINDGYPYLNNVTYVEFIDWDRDEAGYPMNPGVWKLDRNNDNYPWIVGFVPIHSKLIPHKIYRVSNSPNLMNTRFFVVSNQQLDEIQINIVEGGN